ncbi:MAG: NUDIX domain-containing protein [bacterium]
MADRGIRVVAAEIEQDGRFLITQRRPTAVLPLLWEFPSGRVEDGETDEEALAREIRERMDAEIRVGRLSMFIKHEYEDYDLDLRVPVRAASDELSRKRVHDWRWDPRRDGRVRVPPADARTSGCSSKIEAPGAWTRACKCLKPEGIWRLVPMGIPRDERDDPQGMTVGMTAG